MSHHSDHHHDHHHDTQETLSYEEKLVKLLAHWIRHNDDHAETYREWAKRAKENDMADVCALLEEAAEITMSISKTFEKAANVMRET